MRLSIITFSLFIFSSCTDVVDSALSDSAPVISFSANPSSVVIGSSTSLLWSSSQASSCLASGAWSGEKSISGSEKVIISSIGNQSFYLSCSGNGGSSFSVVTIEGYRETEGVVVDGYISGASVFIDENENFVVDELENITTSDSEGRFSIKYADGNLISLGGTDLDSQTLLDNLLITHKIQGHTDFKVITPITSVAAFLDDSSIINTALGIDASIDIFSFDPVINKGDNGINDYLFEKGNQITILAFALQNIVNDLNATNETTQDFYRAISNELEAEFLNTGTKVDIETDTFITNVIENIFTTKSISIDDIVKANIVTALAGVLPVIQVQSTDNLTTAVIRFGLSTLQNDIVDFANGTATHELISSYSSDILNYIADDQNIDSNQITPNIVAIDDIAKVNEDESVIINVVANDSYTTTSPITLTAGNGEHGSTMLTESSPQQMIYVPNTDFYGADAFNYTIAQGDKTSSAEVVVTISPVNDDPSIDIASILSIPENQKFVTNVSVSDVDKDILSLTLGGIDAASFNLTSENILRFKENPDFETKTSYGITLFASDGINEVTKDITINVTDKYEGFSLKKSYTVNEGDSLQLISIHKDNGFTVTFQKLQILSGNSDSLSMTSSGLITGFDFEQSGSSTTVVVEATDGTSTITNQVMEIIVANINEAPVFTSSATFSAAENQTAIGTVTTTDAEGDTVTYSVSSSDSSVAINTSSGLLVFNSAPDYEAKSSHSMVVTASDGTNSTTQNITVNVTNVNDNTPSITSSATFSVAENQTAIGTVTATDADGDALTYSISSASANTNNAFPQDDHASLDETDYYVVSPSTGQSVTLRVYDIDDQMKVTFKNSSGVVQQELTYSGSGSTINVLDYITADGSTIELELTNGAAGYTMAWELSIAGSVVNSNSCGQYNQFGCAGNSSSSGVVYETTIYLGDTSSDILVDADTGVLTFNSAPNYETKSSYTASVTASDGSLTATQSITVNVTDVNDAPTATAANYYMNLLPQDQTSGVITLSGTDEDGDTLTYSIVSNGSYGTASLSGATVTYQTNANTQSAQSESFTFKVNDGTLDSSAATISIDLRTDPLYQYQWHLNNTGQTNFATNGGTSGVDLNVDTVIAGGITGDGVKVSIVDDGLELAHEDLIDNVISGSWDFVNADSDPTQPSTYAGGGHGTSVAGLIAAVGWNNKGVRGIAPEASIFGANFIENQASGNEAKALGVNSPGGVTADIYNMSYGYGVGGSSYNLRSFLTSTNEAKFVNGVENLRGGKGALYIKSSGNDYGSSSTNMCGTGQPLSCTETTIDETNQSPYVVVVGALDADGVKTTYSTPGSSVWVSGFGGEYGYDSSIFSGLSDNIYDPAMMTVDRSSCSLGYSRNDTGGNRFNREGYNYTEQTTLNSDCNYNSSFNGTSSAAPTVSGVIALMLEANPNLTWRDVKHLLVTTSDKVDASRTHNQQGLVQYGWTQNSAGYEHHNWYGFGQINASAAVTAAQSYTANSRGTWASSGYQSSGTLNVSLPDLTVTSNAISVTKPNGSNDFVEFVRVSLSFNHASAKTVGVRLTSPDGTTINLMQPYTNVNNPGSISFDIGVSGFYGESIEGNWTIDLTDYVGDDVTGILSNWGIEVWGN